MARNKKVDDSELEKVTGGTGDSGPTSNQDLAAADPDSSSDDLADAAIDLGDDMIVIDRQN